MLIGTLEAVPPLSDQEPCEAVSLDFRQGGRFRNSRRSLRARFLRSRGRAKEGRTAVRSTTVFHLLRDAAGAQACAKERGVAVEVRRGEHFFDAAPISILVDEWLRELDVHIGYNVNGKDSVRTFFVRSEASVEPHTLEQTLAGARLQVERCGCACARRSSAASP